MFYFKTEELARAYALKTGRTFTDLGATAAEGKRYAVAIVVMAEAE